MKKITLLCVLGILCVIGRAQLRVLNPLTVGDAVPDIEFNTIINYKDTSARLSDFKGKLVILDFWASWCGSCLQAFPKMDSLQKFFNQDVQFILVNNKRSRDNLTKILKVKSRMDSILQRHLELPIVINDSIAGSYFWFMQLPHYIWIDKNRVIKAITSSEYVTKYNINSVIHNRKTTMPVKWDIIPEPAN